MHCYPSLWKKNQLAGFVDYWWLLMIIVRLWNYISRLRGNEEKGGMSKQLIRHTPKVIIADAGLRNIHILDIKRLSKREVTVHQCLAKTQVGKKVFWVKRLGIIVNRVVRSDAWQDKFVLSGVWSDI